MNGLRGYELVLRATGGTSGRLRLTEISFDAGRGDDPFVGLERVPVIDMVRGRAARFVVRPGVVWQGRAYLGTFSFQASGRARGMFDVTVQPAPHTALVDSANRPIEVRTSSVARIFVR